VLPFTAYLEVTVAAASRVLGVEASELEAGPVEVNAPLVLSITEPSRVYIVARRAAEGGSREEEETGEKGEESVEAKGVSVSVVRRLDDDGGQWKTHGTARIVVRGGSKPQPSPKAEADTDFEGEEEEEEEEERKKKEEEATVAQGVSESEQWLAAEKVIEERGMTAVDTSEMYAKLAESAGLAYGPAFARLRGLWRGEDETIGRAVLRAEELE
jgi:hypothetical protein